MSETENKTKSRKPIKRKLVVAAFVGGIAACAIKPRAPTEVEATDQNDE